jgi:hypothetical protein
VRRAATAVTQCDEKDALTGFTVSWPEVKVIRKALTDHFPPANSSFGTDGIQPVWSRVEQLTIIGTLKKGLVPRFLNGYS